MRRFLGILFLVLCSGAQASDFDTSKQVMNNLIATYSGQSAYDCSLFDTACGVMDNLTAQHTGQNIATVYPDATAVMNEVIVDNMGVNIFPVAPKAAIAFGDQNFPTMVLVNNLNNVPNITVEAIGSGHPIVDVGTAQIDTFPGSGGVGFTYHAVNPDDLTVTAEANHHDGVVIHGDVVIYGGLRFWDNNTTLTINGDLYLFGGQSLYLQMQYGKLQVNGNVYLDGKLTYYLIVSGNIYLSGDIFVYHHLANSGNPAVTVSGSLISCRNASIASNTGVGDHDAVQINEGAEIDATNTISFYGNVGDTTNGSAGNGVTIGATIQAQTLNFMANVSGNDAEASGVRIISGATLNYLSSINFVGNLGYAASSYGVRCDRLIESTQNAYSANNTAVSGGTGFYYLGTALSTLGLSGTTSYTGPVPKVDSAITTSQNDDFTNADAPVSGGWLINNGTLTLDNNLTIQGDLIIVGDSDDYLVLGGYELTVQGDIILDGAGHIVDLNNESAIHSHGQITIQNHGSSSSASAVNVDLGTTFGGIAGEGNNLKALTIVGNIANTSGVANTVAFSGTVDSATGMFNVVGNTLTTDETNNPSASIFRQLDGAIDIQGAINFIGNSANAGMGVLIASTTGGLLSNNGINFACNKVNFVGTTADDSFTVGVFVAGGSASVMTDNGAINFLGNSVQTSALAWASGVAVGTVAGILVPSLAADHINFVGNFAVGTATSTMSDGFRAVAVDINDFSGGNVGAATVAITANSSINFVGNMATSGAGGDNTNNINSAVTIGASSTTVVGFELQTETDRSKINFVGNQSFLSNAIEILYGAALGNLGAHGQINFYTNGSEATQGDTGTMIDGSATITCAGPITFLLNSGNDYGLFIQGDAQVLSPNGTSVDSYTQSSGWGMFFNNQDYGELNIDFNINTYTGLIPPVI